MAGWLSSKLRLAETFLNQVDATAALSLTDLKHELAHVRPSPHPPLRSLWSPQEIPRDDGGGP